MAVGHALDNGIAMFGCVLLASRGSNVPPGVRLYIVLRNALTIAISDAQVVLRGSVALLGCLAIPIHRLDVVLRNSLTFVVPESKAVLR